MNLTAFCMEGVKSCGLHWNSLIWTFPQRSKKADGKQWNLMKPSADISLFTESVGVNFKNRDPDSGSCPSFPILLLVIHPSMF
jgi:hypothetical protein